MDYFEILTLSESLRWKQIVTSFPCHDIYYLPNYVKAFQINGDGEPLLLFYNDGHLRSIKVVMKRDISFFKPFIGKIEINKYFDMATPYGYGGFIFDGIISDSNLLNFIDQYKLFCREHGIISDFVRYHPVLSNSDKLRNISNVIDLGRTISIDLTSEKEIWDNFTSKNRNCIRKAQKSGVQIYYATSKELLVEFIKMYNATMERDNADDYYFFGENFYNSILTDLKDNFEVFYAVLGSKIIAMSIILYAHKYMHYHLSASRTEYMQFAPTNLLLYEAACWGSKQGYTSFHLGGGLGSDENGGLFRFKAAFNKNSKNLFSIGKDIFNHEFYNELVKLRMLNDPSFDINTSFFPKYRG